MTRIVVDLDRTLGTVSPHLYGSFIEHLGRCIYGGVFDEDSPRSDERGFRTDVLEQVRQIGTTMVRWPGGNFVSAYHWTDGIGPREQRPKQMELAWHSTESNRFGTDEFLTWCETAGVEPYICLNMGTGTIDEARNWLEYCNGTGDTYWANLRLANGRAEPYNVRYWGLGNELYGYWQVGQWEAPDYVKAARQWAKVLRRIDPSVKIVSCGESGLTDWDQVVVDGLARWVDYHSIHVYTGTHDYWSNVLAPHFAERALGVVSSMIERARYEQQIDHPIGVAYDEWNVWYRTEGSEGLEEVYDLSDALAVASYLNVFVRQSRNVQIANLAQLVNVIAPIVATPDGVLRQSTFHPFRLWATHMQGVAVDAVAHGETVDPAWDGGRWPHRIAGLGPFPLLDVSATRDPDRRRLTIGAVNRDPDRPASVSLSIGGGEAAGAVRIHEVTGPSPKAVNSFDAPDTIGVSTREADASGDVTFELAPHSCAVVEVDLR